MVTCSNGTAAHFYTEKIGDRWWLCDPAGHGFFMEGVANINYNVDAEQQTLNQSKYSSGPTSSWKDNWDLEMVHRLLAWGFNTVADDSYAGVTPWYTDPAWSPLSSDNTIPVKLPFTTGINVSRYMFTNTANCGAPSAIKDMINGVGSAYTAYRYDYGDYFDPNFSSCVGNIVQISGIHQILTSSHSDYYLYLTLDETDQTGGLFGPGPDYQTLPAVSLGGNAAWVTLATAPTETSNSTWGVTYSNTTVYTKQEFSKFMAARYSNNIAALNAAWGSSYTTFGASGGGWGIGTGLLDEDGTCPSKGLHSCWVGAPVTLAGETTAMQADMSAFYTHYLDQYLSVMQSQYQNATYGVPGILLEMGLGGFSTPPRREALTEAAKYLDLALMAGIPPPPWACAHAPGGSCTDSQQRIDFVAQYLGDRPWINWEGIDANQDSAESAYPSTTPYTTQAQRAAGYQRMLSESENAKTTATSSYPVVGFYWWGAFDQDGERLNWGLLTPNDNPYDGKSATIVGAGTDQWGYPTGGEHRNYGDFISAVKASNESAPAAMRTGAQATSRSVERKQSTR